MAWSKVLRTPPLALQTGQTLLGVLPNWMLSLLIVRPRRQSHCLFRGSAFEAAGLGMNKTLSNSLGRTWKGVSQDSQFHWGALLPMSANPSCSALQHLQVLELVSSEMWRSQECISSTTSLLFSVFMWDLNHVPEPPQPGLGMPSHGDWSRGSDWLPATSHKASSMLKMFGFGFLAVTQSPAVGVCLLNCNKIKVMRTPNSWWILEFLFLSWRRKDSLRG